MTIFDTPEFTQRYSGKFYGKYRGYVVDNRDPRKLGRLRVIVPDVFGVDFVTDWAYPCLPYAGNSGIGSFIIPPIGETGSLVNKTLVWVEFEGGEPGKPIWTGSCWEEPSDISEVPVEALPGTDFSPHRMVFKTVSGHLIEIDDVSGGEEIKLTHKSGQYIHLDVNGDIFIKAKSGRKAYVGDISGTKKICLNGDSTSGHDHSVSFTLSCSSGPVTGQITIGSNTDTVVASSTMSEAK